MSRRRNPAAILRKLRGKPARQILQHAARGLAERVGSAELDFPLLPRDLADSGALPAAPEPRQAGDPPRLGWLTVPPSAGSGGHTTLFRMVQAAVDAGYDTTLLLYDRYGGDTESKIATIRRAWPWLTCAIEPAAEVLDGFDACIASSWPTAHVLASRSHGSRNLYFIQDFEPYFYPRGTMYALAKDTYRFGFRHIALGRMVRDSIRNELQVDSELVPFGCDTETYRSLPRPGDRRSGVVFYAKRGNDRRGFELAVRALEIFHRRHPDEPINVYGDHLRDAPFPVISHGSLPPERLNELYNSVVAGLALSFTNISLVAEEMIAAGAVPVVNDSPLARADLPNPHAAWAVPTPSGLASALSGAVARGDREEHAGVVAASAADRSWRPTQDAVVRIIAAELKSAGGKRNEPPA